MTENDMLMQIKTRLSYPNKLFSQNGNYTTKTLNSGITQGLGNAFWLSCEKPECFMKLWSNIT